ncbi:MAG: hypothetical protein GX267_07520, partial [Fibrobacter sp.]|nr:hypothetical protein [Fibrobacter sp.]
MSFKKIILTGGLGAFLFFAGCQQTSVNPLSQIDDPSNTPDQLVLGKKLENPYSVSSMKRARDSLVAQGVLSKSAVTDADLGATHYYIRFKPETDTQFVKLNSDSTLVLWDYPLEYEILEGGTVYRDPEIPAGKPNYLYTAVDVNQLLPSVEYEILEELILEPEPESSFLEKKRVSSYYSILEQEALRITDNVPKNEQGLAKIAGKWRPTGNIQVYDDVLGRNVPVVSVNVRTRNWFRWWDGYTDINGNFRCSKEYLGDLAYSLRWQYPDNKFDIRSGSLGQAFFNGPNNKKGSWNLVISSGMSWVYGHIFRAGSYYIGQEPFGLSNTPFQRVSVCTYDENAPATESGHYNNANENIIMYQKNSSGTAYTSIQLFSIASHEFGHAHHDEIYTGGSVYNNVNGRIKESWAVAVSYFLTSSNYSLPINTYDYWYTKQNFTSSSNSEYTPLIIDLIDSYNQRTRSSSFLDDPVSGYTLQQIEGILKKSGCKSVNDFKNEIKALPLPAGVS